MLRSELPCAIARTFTPAFDSAPKKVDATPGTPAMSSPTTARIEHPVVTNGRHAAALDQALAKLTKAATAVRDGLSEEWILEDLKEARRELGAITGGFDVEDLYDRIFSTFCIGK